MNEDILKKLLTIQQTLSAPKNQYNKFGGYKYRSCEDILEGLKPCMESTKTAIIITDDIVEIGGRFYVKATATLLDCESNSINAAISNTAYAREEESKKGMDSSQITGSASSYARKYALNGLFCIDDTKDVDTMNNTDKKESGKPKQGKEVVKTSNTKQNKASNPEQTKIEPTPEYIDKVKQDSLKMLMNKKGVEMKSVLERYGIPDLSHMTLMQYKNAMSGLERTKEKKKENIDLGL